MVSPKNFNHPELISFGLSVDTLHSILNIGGELVKEGSCLEVGIDYDAFFEKEKAQLISVYSRSIKDYFGYASWLNKTSEFPALQLIWTDRNGRYPWEAEFEQVYKFWQPLLDRNADFKFREEKNLGVQLPEDIRLIAMEQLILSDLSLNDLFNLVYGESAKRKFVGDKWDRVGFI